MAKGVCVAQNNDNDNVEWDPRKCHHRGGVGVVKGSTSQGADERIIAPTYS